MLSVGSVVGRALQPWRSARTWWALAHAVLDLPVGVVAFVPTVVLLVATVALAMSFPLTPLALLPALGAIAFGRIIGAVERSRVSALLGVELANPVPPVVPGPWLHSLRQLLLSVPRWKAVGYCLLRLPVAVLCLSLLMAAWCISFVLVALPAFINALPNDAARLGLFEVEAGMGLVPLFLAGTVGLVLVAPWATVGVAYLDTGLARWFLGPDEGAALVAKAERAESSRVAAVDAAEAERRRIERDLHDGAQQRLVALAMDLGVARHVLDSDPERGRQLVAKAHDEAKAALKEIRDLVRGIHPVILEDRGLDAALSAVVTRCPVHVELDVHLPHRPPPAVESAAYFVVSEALANVARHAGARRAHVSIAPRGTRLLVEVRDDGVGGADPARGTGLAGLAERVAGLGGTLDLLSPPGGPTTLLVELPCAS